MNSITAALIIANATLAAGNSYLAAECRNSAYLFVAAMNVAAVVFLILGVE